MQKNRNRHYTENEIAGILESHADSLLKGIDLTDELMTENRNRYPVIDSLLRLAQRLSLALVPVEPSERFVEDLRASLDMTRQRQAQRAARWGRLNSRMARVSRPLSRALSLLSMLALGLHVLGSIAMIITLIASHRRKRLTSAA
jgi:hypothetical protein